MSILVGIDGSEHAERALVWALREAALRSTHVSIATAFRVRPFDAANVLDAERDNARAMVESTLDRVVGPRHADVDVSTTAIMGRGASEAILRHSRDAELIVVGSRGLGGFSGLLLGSVSHQVAAHAKAPVAVIPHDLKAEETDGIRAIVVGVDGSPSSAAALRWGLAEARRRDVPLTAVHAYGSLRDSVPAGFDEARVEALERQARSAALDMLDRWLSESEDTRGVTVAREVSRAAPAKALTIDAADESAVLVVGRRGRGGFSSLLLGSVSQQCLHHARGPVVVTPAED